MQDMSFACYTIALSLRTIDSGYNIVPVIGGSIYSTKHIVVWDYS